MKIVIAGGSGLIGQALTALALKLRHEVVILTRTAKPQIAGRTVQWDGTTAGDWTGELSDADVIVNLCGASIGEGRWTARRKAEIRASRLQPTQILAQTMNALAHKPIQVQASAIGFYPVGSEPLDERAPPGNNYLAALAKAWEHAAEAYAGPTLIARFGVVLSNKDGALPRMSLPFKMFIGGPLGSGMQWFSWITDQDAARAILFALEHKLTGAVNLVAPTAVTNRMLTQALGRALHRPAFLPTPAFALRLLLGEQADLLLDSQRIEPARLQHEGFEFSHPDIETALNALYGRAD